MLKFTEDDQEGIVKNATDDIDKKGDHDGIMNLKLKMNKDFCAYAGKYFTMIYYYDNFQLNNWFQPYANLYQNNTYKTFGFHDTYMFMREITFEYKPCLWTLETDEPRSLLVSRLIFEKPK